MAIKRVAKTEFDKCNPARHPIMAKLTTEESWFKDDSGYVIGTVLLDKTDNDWSWVALGRDERGSFRAVEMNASLIDQDTAEKALLAKMTELESSGAKVFPQGD